MFGGGSSDTREDPFESQSITLLLLLLFNYLVIQVINCDFMLLQLDLQLLYYLILLHVHSLT